MAEQSELRMNLAAIKRVDPYAKAIIDSSAHVAFYTFNADDTEWEKTDVEGAFFIYSRTAEPLYSIFINNRLNTNSLVEPIAGQLELQSQPPFLLYRNERSRIRGFWFYNKTECDRIGELVEKLIKSGGQNGVAPPVDRNVATKPKQPINQQQQQHQHPNAVRSTGNAAQQPQQIPKGSQQQSSDPNGGPGSGVDIFTMLSKAQEDFNNAQSPAVAKNPPARTPRGPTTAPQPIPVQQQQQQPAHQQPSVPQGPPADGTSLSVMNFFAAAVPATAKEVPFFQRMLSQPMSVDQLEKQHQNHRSVTPQHPKPDQKQPTPPRQSAAKTVPMAQTTKSTAEVENGFGFMRIASPPAADLLGTSPLATFINSANLSGLPKTTAEKPSAPSGPTELSAAKKRLHPFQLDLLRMFDGQTPEKPALMAPTMFAAVTPSTTIPNTIEHAMLSNVAQTSLNHQHVAEVATQQARSQPEPLTQSQLLQAMNYLIKNDPDFVRKLHEAYLKSFTEMVSL